MRVKIWVKYTSYMFDRSNNDVLILEDHLQLRLLARLLRNQEEPLMLTMRSEIDRIEYLDMMNDAHDNMVSLLSEAEALAQAKAQAHPAKAKVSKEIEKYIIYAANWTMQCIRNCCMRVTCIERIKAHFDSIVKELEELDGDNKDEVEDLLSMVKMYTLRMWEYGNTSRSTITRALSQAFSQALIMEGITMEEFVLRTKNRFGYKPDFEDLEEHQKLEVNEAVIDYAGRATLPTMYDRKFRKPGLGDLMDNYGIGVPTAIFGIGNSESQELKFHTGEMPDGMAIAFELSHLG